MPKLPKLQDPDRTFITVDDLKIMNHLEEQIYLIRNNLPPYDGEPLFFKRHPEFRPRPPRRNR